MDNLTELSTTVADYEIGYAGVSSVVREMESLIGRTARSDGFKDKKDYFVGIFDTDGAMFHAMLSYSGLGMANPVIDKFSKESFNRGDIFFYNDPYTTDGVVQHLPDSVVCAPIFSGDQLFGFAAAFGHLDDIGGDPNEGDLSRPCDVLEEGMAYPPIRVGSDWESFPWFEDLFLRNSRRPNVLRSDLSALIAACRLAQTRIDALTDRMGTSVLRDGCRWALSRNSELSHAVIQKHLRAGTYQAREELRFPGLDARNVEVVTSLRVDQGKISFDLTDSTDQIPLKMNYFGSFNGIRLLAGLALMVYDDRLELNEGLFAAIEEVSLRDGSIVRPSFPAAVGSRSQVKNAVSNTICRVLGDASDGYMTASQPTYSYAEFLFGNGVLFCETFGIGLGARPYCDGPDAIYAPAQRNYPVEDVEAKYPLKVLEYDLNTDSCGAGEFRGGCGVVRRFRVLADCQVVPGLSHSATAAEGVGGGHAGGRSRVTVRRAGSDEEQEVPALGVPQDLFEGDEISFSTAGGGGVGHPGNRTVASVRGDLNSGFISAKYARNAYAKQMREIDQQR